MEEKDVNRRKQNKKKGGRLEGELGVGERKRGERGSVRKEGVVDRRNAISPLVLAGKVP